MSVEGAIVATMKGDAGITAIAGTRIYPMIAPQSAPFPRITYTTINTDVDHTFDGASGLRIARMQIDNRAETDSNGSGYGQAKALAAAVESALDGLAGTVDGSLIQTVIVQTVGDVFEPPTDGNQNGVVNVVLELLAYYE